MNISIDTRDGEKNPTENFIVIGKMLEYIPIKDRNYVFPH